MSNNWTKVENKKDTNTNIISTNKSAYNDKDLSLKNTPLQSFVVFVGNVVSEEKYNKNNKYNNTTNTTIKYNDIFTKDSQPNKIKWALFVLSYIKKDFKGLDYTKMAQVGGVINMKVMSVIIKRMKISGDITLYNKNKINPEKCCISAKKCCILTENAKNEVKELIENIYLDRIEESKKVLKMNKISDKLEDSIKNIEEELMGNKDVWEIIDQSIIIDINRLLNINPTLVSAFLDYPTKTIQKLEMNLNNGILDIFKDKSIRIKNLPKFYNKKNRKINSSNLDKIYNFDVEVVTSTEILPATTQRKFECPSCGTIISVLQEIRGDKREPNRCSCGRRGGFKQISSSIIDYRTLLCSDNQESIEDSAPIRCKRYHLLGDVANIDDALIQSASKLKITGIPFLREGKQGDEIDININYIEPNDDLLVLNFSEEEKELFGEFSKQNPVEKIKKEVFDLSVKGYSSVKTGLIIQQVGGVSKELNNGTYKRGDPHIILIGDPATAKSILTSNAQKLSTRCAKADANRGTSAGLTGTFEYNQQLGRKVRMPGLFDRAKGGLLIWEEFNEADDSVQATLKTPLESSEYSVTLATGSITSKCPFSFLATMNPKSGNYLDYTKPILQQVPLSPALKTRSDLIFGGFTKPKNKMDIDEILEKQDLNIDIDKNRFIFLKKYLAYCKLQTTTIPTKINFLVNNFCSGLILNTESTFRIKDTLTRLIESFAKTELREKANTQDFNNAKKLFLNSLQSTSLDKSKYDYSRFVEVSKEDVSDMDKIEETYNQIKDKEGRCSSLELLKYSQLESIKFNNALRLLLKRNIIKSDMIKDKIKDDRI